MTAGKKKLPHPLQRRGNTVALVVLGFLVDSDGKESACNAGDPSLILESGRSPGERNGYLFLENSTDKRTWWAIVHGVPKSWTQLSG